MPSVDVIVPYYNTPLPFVQAALESVQKQTFRDWKALLVNDGSQPENTVQLEALLSRLNEPRILYKKTPNQGVSAARNAAIRLSNAPYIAFLDADDLWHPQCLERLTNTLEKTPSASLVHANNDVLRPDGTLERYAKNRAYLKNLSDRELSLTMLEGNFVAIVTVMLRRAAAEAAGLFDETFGSIEDKEFWIRLLGLGNRFVYLDETLAIYRVHGTNSSKNTEKMKEGRLRLIEKVDKLAAANPNWLGAEWPMVRRKMRHHAFHEAAETALEQNKNGLAFRYSLPGAAGVSTQSLKLLAKSMIEILLGRGL